MHIINVAFSYPVGHGVTSDYGHNPDIIARHPNTYASYVNRLYTALNPTGQGANPTVLQRLITFSKTLSADPDTAIQQMAGYASQNGYDLPFLQCGTGNTDPGIDNLDRQKVGELLGKIRKACCATKK